ncbi:hypothetical protein JCM10914A_02170 [Paenibacillus sp. JCM 10914]|uniref:ABC transporter permease n=1 Tax=Paenibacillus sp. JCM 10914 TaxID=1236974 RepID=UPI0003CC7296|nr:ABC transporter permease [Paenibacillus sp. JCM 10914]GAE06852.1 multidrug ABC transporter permease [Paenibacillus sp. JCM 10914]
MTIFAYTILRSIRSIPTLILLFGIPIVIIFLPMGETFALPIGLHYYGILLLFSASKLVHILMEDRKKKIMTRIGVAPITHLQYLTQNLLAFALLLIAQSAIITVGGWLYHGDGVLGNAAALFMIYGMFSITAISFSLAWCSLFRHPESSTAIMLGIVLVMALLGGTLFPIEVMPNLLQRIAMFFPTYWLHEGMSMAAENNPLGDHLIPLGMLLLFTLAFLLIGSRRKLA